MVIFCPRFPTAKDNCSHPFYLQLSFTSPGNWIWHVFYGRAASFTDVPIQQHRYSFFFLYNHPEASRTSPTLLIRDRKAEDERRVITLIRRNRKAKNIKYTVSCHGDAVESPLLAFCFRHHCCCVDIKSFHVGFIVCHFFLFSNCVIYNFRTSCNDIYTLFCRFELIK